nr:CoA transferase [arsenite-oxidising bacterium NT-25]
MMSAFRPLDGIRVLDLTNVLSGPLACYQLAALGADVIKVEPVGQGDLARQLGDDVELNGAHMGASFLAQNAGKRSVTLNLKSPEGVGIFLKLVKTADVIVENFRPGVMDRLGVGYERLRKERPSLIYCAISGFGQKGPLSERPAYDQIIQGAAGVMSVTGENAERPLRVGYPMADSIGGLTAAMVICGALVSPKRGAFIDVSMMSSVMATMGWAVSNWLTAGSEPRPIGNENATSAPSGAFRCKDGLLNITANKQEQWEALAHYLELGELIAEPQFRTRDDRKRNRTSLLPLIEAKLTERYVAACADELTALGVPAGEVLTVPQALAHPQTAVRQQLAQYEDVLDGGRSLHVLRPGFMVDEQPAATELAPPRLGEHTDEVLSELGLTAEELNDLHARGVI